MRLYELLESLDKDQKSVGQVAGEEKARKIGPVLGKAPKQHPYKGRLVGEEVEDIDEASLATMRSYFDGDENAEDPTKSTMMRKYYAALDQKLKDKNKKKPEDINKLDKQNYVVINKRVNEVAPPGMEDWIKDRKADFKKRYGDRWQEVLYATAWKRKNAGK